MPNKLAEEPEVPASAPAPVDSGPSREEILAALRQEQDARAGAEALAYQAGQAAQRNVGPVTDPLDRYAAEGIALPADEQKRLLSDAIGLRARGEAGRAFAEMERRRLHDRAQMANEMALQSVFSQNPDLADPKNHPKFAAAMVEVDMEAKAAGVNYSPQQLATKAAQKYRQAGAAPPPPYVEGAGAPGVTMTGVPPVEEGPNMLETLYGMKKGTIEPLYDPATQLMENSQEFIRSNNAEMFKRGVRSSMPGVTDTLKQT